MPHVSRSFLEEAVTALDFPGAVSTHITSTGDGELTSAFPLVDFASDSIGVVGLAISQLIEALFAKPAEVVVDRRLASFWFGWSIDPIGWTLPAAWDSIAGDYATSDGWIRLHTNAPHHKKAALGVLQCADDRSVVAEHVSRWDAEALETAIVSQSGCAAVMRSHEQWLIHPQGRAVSSEPLMAFSSVLASWPASTWRPTPARPLAGLKVLDLTRVLAGPVATRLLAGYGAEVLRIDPPDWQEPGLIPEVTLGKRCAHLNLQTADGRAIFAQLLSQADVLVHGYRPGALDALGFSEAQRRVIAPGLIDVSLNAYGWTGPWSARRGFDSLVQMSSGIVMTGMVWKQADCPVPLPVQALDQTTGYLMAAAVVRSLSRRVSENKASTARLSLARTGHSLTSMTGEGSQAKGVAKHDADFNVKQEQTEWGPARRCHSPLLVGGTPLSWESGAASLGSAEPRWWAGPQ